MLMLNKVDVLDKGYVILQDYMGSDLTVVNSARVSFDKKVDSLRPQDERLIRFLADHGHTSPFRHAMLQFEVYAPLMVARQWWKYRIGSAHLEEPIDPMEAWNESSRRYVTEEPTFYIPKSDQWRSAPENKKQGSGKPLDVDTGEVLTANLKDLISQCLVLYEDALARGVTPEQARGFLPAYFMYVRWYWTVSLQGLCHFLLQRMKHDAQREIQEYALAIYTLSRPIFPVAIEALVGKP